MKKIKNPKKEEFNINKIFFPLVDEEKITITKNKYDSLINEIGYLRGSKRILIEESITISIEEYRELLIYKGKYQELKELVNVNAKLERIK